MKSDSPILVRDLTKNDRRHWQALWQAYLTFYETILPPEMYDRAFERLLSGKEGEMRCLLALMDTKPVGLVHTLTHRHGWFENEVVYLQDLFVSEPARTKGVGRALITEVYRRADLAGTPKVYWLTARDNMDARRLYDKIGTGTDFMKYVRP